MDKYFDINESGCSVRCKLYCADPHSIRDPSAGDPHLISLLETGATSYHAQLAPPAVYWITKTGETKTLYNLFLQCITKNKLIANIPCES